MAYVDLSTKKTRKRLSATLNESAADASHMQKDSFARKQLEKMGWTEGTGLGKNRDGRVSHIKAKKREDSAGLGVEKVIINEMNDVWWKDSVGSTLARLQEKKGEKKDSKKGEKSKKESKTDDGETEKSAKKSKGQGKKEKREAAKAKKVMYYWWNQNLLSASARTTYI